MPGALCVIPLTQGVISAQGKAHWAMSKDFFGYHIIGVLPASSDGDQCMRDQSLNHVQLSAALWTEACLSIGFSQQEYWSGLAFPPLGDLSDQGSNPHPLHCKWILSPLSHQGSPI